MRQAVAAIYGGTATDVLVGDRRGVSGTVPVIAVRNGSDGLE
jgi:hypothetical protein